LISSVALGSIPSPWLSSYASLSVSCLWNYHSLIKNPKKERKKERKKKQHSFRSNGLCQSSPNLSSTGPAAGPLNWTVLINSLESSKAWLVMLKFLSRTREKKEEEILYRWGKKGLEAAAGGRARAWQHTHPWLSIQFGGGAAVFWRTCCQHEAVWISVYGLWTSSNLNVIYLTILHENPDLLTKIKKKKQNLLSR